MELSGYVFYFNLLLFIHDLLKIFLAFERIPIPSSFIPPCWRNVPRSGLAEEDMGNVC